MSAHDYLSTACLHGLHDRCRLVCKFCAAACRCGCHGERVNTTDTCEFAG
jgi:hypothetical protein